MTIDEAIEEIKDNMSCDYCISGCDKCDISSCSNKDSFNMAIQALEKQKPNKIKEYWICPVCNHDFGMYKANYCPHCGQRLNWR